jgi:hypothetical protein
MSSQRPLFLLIVLLSGAVEACEDRCANNSSYSASCDGDTLVECSGDGLNGSHIYETACENGEVCVQSGARAACVDKSRTSCTGFGSGRCIDGKTIQTCDDDVSFFEMPHTCTDGYACYSKYHDAECMPEPLTSCEADACAEDGKSILRCNVHLGIVSYRSSCSGESECRLQSNGSAVCALAEPCSASTRPFCSASGRYLLYCDQDLGIGTVVEDCSLGDLHCRGEGDEISCR